MDMHPLLPGKRTTKYANHPAMAPNLTHGQRTLGTASTCMAPWSNPNPSPNPSPAAATA